MLTNSLGEVVSRRDFLPFGEELYADGQSRTTANKYTTSGQDTVRKRFTGYEKDPETGLDFAEARMYQNKHGRFTAVDPLLSSASPGNPQTFNRYTYTGNNPVNFTDPSGLDWCKDSNGDIYNRSTCGKKETNITNSEGEIGQCSSACVQNNVAVGDRVRWLANGKLELVRSARAIQHDNTTMAQATEQLEADRNVLATAASDIAAVLASAGQTVAEDTGLRAGLQLVGLDPGGVEPSGTGQAIGHSLSIAIGTAEIAAGGSLIASGGGGELVGLVLDGTGVGLPLEVTVNVVSAIGIVTGGALVLHGTYTVNNGATGLYNQMSGRPEYWGTPENLDRMRNGKGPKDPDGVPDEGHHDQQKPDGQLIPMSRNDHRGPGNHKKNHPDRGPSKIDPKQRARDRREMWKRIYREMTEDK